MLLSWDHNQRCLLRRPRKQSDVRQPVRNPLGSVRVIVEVGVQNDSALSTAVLPIATVVATSQSNPYC